MSAMFNNTASQREAAFIKAVRQGFFSNSICSNSEHGNTPRCTCQIAGPTAEFFLTLANIIVPHGQAFMVKEETKRKNAINVGMHSDIAVIFRTIVPFSSADF